MMETGLTSIVTLAAGILSAKVVYYQGKPVWAMNYYGHILRADLITPAQAGQVIQASLSKMYSEGRFLGGFEYHHEGFIYIDASEGSVISFRGREYISHPRRDCL
jgi:hypothetical protein